MSLLRWIWDHPTPWGDLFVLAGICITLMSAAVATVLIHE